MLLELARQRLWEAINEGEKIRGEECDGLDDLMIAAREAVETQGGLLASVVTLDGDEVLAHLGPLDGAGRGRGHVSYGEPRAICRP